MPKRGIKKRLLSKVSALFSIRGTKQRFEIHGEHNQLDCNSHKQSDIKTMSSLIPQAKHRGIRFSRRAVQRSKYLRQKFGVRKTVMGFSPRVGSITEEDESEITLWMLAENAENVISEGMAWLRNSDECCEDSTDMEEEDPEKILQMWIESNSFDNLYDNDESDNDKDDSDSSNFSEDDDDEQESEVTDDDDDDGDGDDDKHQDPITNDCDRNSNEDIDDNVDVMQNSYPPYDSGTESDDEDDGDDDDDDDDTVHHNEDTADTIIEKSCSIYVDDESFDELDDDDDYDDDGDDSYQHSECSAKDNDEFAADITEENSEIDNCDLSDASSNRSNKENISSDSANYPSTIEMEHACDMDKIKDENLANANFPKWDSGGSKDFERDGFDNNDHGNIVVKYEETVCENESANCGSDNQVVREFNHPGRSEDNDSTDDDDNLDINHNDAHNVKYLFRDNANTNAVNVDPDSNSKIFHEQSSLPEKIKGGEKRTTECQYNEEEQTISDDAVIDTVKEEIVEILSRISQIENDFNYMRKSMTEFRS